MSIYIFGGEHYALGPCGPVSSKGRIIQLLKSRGTFSHLSVMYRAWRYFFCLFMKGESMMADAMFVSQYDRIRRGAMLLDFVMGPTWVNKIDLDRLRIMSHVNCVVSQCFGDTYINDEDGSIAGPFYHGLAMIHKATKSVDVYRDFSWYGFSCLWFDDQRQFDGRWKTYIRWRRLRNDRDAT